MEFTPGERAVLNQIRVLYASSPRIDQQMKALTMQWAPTHHESYRKAYDALIEKRLINDAGTQIFRITEAGLRAIGVTVPRPQPVVPRVSAARLAPQTALPATPRRRAGLLSRTLGLLRGRA
jgi:hypothetical protein